MTSIQTDVSDEALVTAIRANMCDFFRHMSRSVPRECFLSHYYRLFCTRISQKPRKGAFVIKVFPRNSMNSVASVSERVFMKQSLRNIS